MDFLYAIIGVTGLGALLNIILKKLVTNELKDKIANVIKMFFKGLGVGCTLGLSKLPILKGLWNSVFEPYIIIFLRILVSNAIDGFTEGLETDNRSLKDD